MVYYKLWTLLGINKLNQKVTPSVNSVDLMSLLNHFNLQKLIKLKTNNFDKKMNISKKEWFCYQCSLQFDSNLAYVRHLKLLHKQIIETKFTINEPKTNELLANDTKSDSNNQITLCSLL